VVYARAEVLLLGAYIVQAVLRYARNLYVED
jgi:hypothetical protein